MTIICIIMAILYYGPEEVFSEFGSLLKLLIPVIIFDLFIYLIAY